MSRNSERYLAICGGVGGAKLALGLSRVLDPSQLTVVVNTGDDFEHLGLLICPDLDTVCYTLAGVVDPVQGWGRSSESWNALAEVEHLDGETWFRLGDKDLGLHLVRRALLDQGLSLSAVTAHIARRLGIAHEILPMSDDPVRTEVETDQGHLAFQHYFVRERCGPQVRSIGFAGSQSAQPAESFIRALRNSALKGVIICPSNPFLSVDPILSIPGVRQALSDTSVPVIAVSPVVGGQAIKGPTAKIMQELGLPVTVEAVADHYAGLLTGLVVDCCDQDSARKLEERLSIHICDTIMKDIPDKITLAGQVLDFISTLGRGVINGLWALVPLKRLATAKQRLAPVLEAAPRTELMLSMAADVLTALIQLEAVERVLVVSEDPAAEQLALDAGVEWFRVSPGGGLNSDLECAAAFAQEQGARQILIVHANLPFLKPEPLRRFITHRSGKTIRLAACKAGTSTNLLLTPLPLAFPLVFGSHSLARFQRLLGEMAEVVRDSALSMDIDNPEDLDCFLMRKADDSPPGPMTQAWIDKSRDILTSCIID